MEIAPNKWRMGVSYTVRQQYNNYREKRRKDILRIKNREEYSVVLNALSRRLWEKLMRTGILSLGEGVGEIEIIKKRTKVWNNNGRITANFPVDNKATRELRRTDEEARKTNFKVRKVDNDFAYSVRFRSSNSLLRNRLYLSFKMFESVRKRFSKDIIDNKIDALMYEL